MLLHQNERKDDTKNTIFNPTFAFWHTNCVDYENISDLTIRITLNIQLQANLLTLFLDC